DRRALLHQFRSDAPRRCDADRPQARRGAGERLCLDRSGVLMATDAPFDAEDGAPAAASPWPRRIARWAAVGLLGLLALVALFLVGLNSDAGRRFVVTQIEKYEFENGMKIGIGRLDGSLYGAMIVRDFSLSDTKGRFLTSPELRIDWRPFAFLSNHVDVRSATARLINVERLPEFKPVPDTDEPLL